jgi:hypothetical protein
MKNTLDYFLEELYFKTSAIVSYSPGAFGGINAAQQPISSVHEVFDENGKLIDGRYKKRVKRFLEEFEWYIEA